MLTIMRRVKILVAAIALTVLAPVPATASGDGPVDCIVNPRTGECSITVTDPGSGGSGGDGSTPPADNPDSSGGGSGENVAEETRCMDGDREVPCEHPELGTWNGAMECYVSLADPQPPKDSPVWEGHTEGAIYMCSRTTREGSTVEATAGAPFWSATDPTASGPDPEALAQQAVEQMNLQAGEIGATPNEGDPDTRMQIIGLPTWLWVDNPGPSTTGPITESVSAGGVTVSATATLDRIEYDMGDGGTVTCSGENAAGTPYESSYGDAPSPTCGYMYETTSANQPGEEFTITAVSHFSVTWNGGGASGTIPLEFTQTRQQRVGEVQAIVTDG